MLRQLTSTSSHGADLMLWNSCHLGSLGLIFRGTVRDGGALGCGIDGGAAWRKSLAHHHHISCCMFQRTD